MTSGPGVTVPNVPNPGSDGGTFEITIVQSWSQETNYNRVTQVALGSGSLKLLAACGYKVLLIPADNQPEGTALSTIDNLKFWISTQVQVPPTTAGQKVPMVVDFHGRKISAENQPNITHN